MPVFSHLELDHNKPTLEAANLNWAVEKRLLYSFNRDTDSFDSVGNYGLFREDTDEFISVVSKRYNPFQNEDVVNFFDDYVHQSGGTITHGGHFKNRDIVLYGTLNQTINLGNDNAAEFKLLARTGHYPGMALEIMFGVIMCACTNQFVPNFNVGNKGFHYQWHNRAFDTVSKETVTQTLDSLKDFIQHYQMLSKQLMSIAMPTPKAETFLIEHLGDTTKPKADQPKAIPRILDIFESSAYLGPNDNFDMTAWRLWNSITQYIDHNPSKRQVRSALIGSGQAIKQQTFKALLEV